ncbi:MAG: hypothetical protein GKR90_05115 [Pseudomonadales bacterium]|nr:hypothetical protein [Pseudomonadales bacterium]
MLKSRSNGVITLLTLLFVLFTFYNRTLQSLLGYWLDSYGPFSHGLINVAFAAYCFVKVSRSSVGNRFSTVTLLQILATCAGATWIAAVCIGAGVVEHVAWFMLGLSTYCLFSKPAELEALVVPFGLLVLALPAWDFVNEPLRDMTTIATTFIISHTNIPAFITGHQIEILSGTFEIASGCSGLNIFLAASSFSLMYAYTAHYPVRKTLAIFTCCAIGAILINWIRILGLIFVAQLWGMKHYLIAVDHYWYGWALTAICIGLVVYFFEKYFGSESKRLLQIRSRQPVSVKRLIVTLVLLLANPIVVTELEHNGIQESETFLSSAEEKLHSIGFRNVKHTTKTKNLILLSKGDTTLEITAFPVQRANREIDGFYEKKLEYEKTYSLYGRNLVVGYQDAKYYQLVSLMQDGRTDAHRLVFKKEGYGQIKSEAVCEVLITLFTREQKYCDTEKV